MIRTAGSTYHTTRAVIRRAENTYHKIRAVIRTAGNTYHTIREVIRTAGSAYQTTRTVTRTDSGTYHTTRTVKSGKYVRWNAFSDQNSLDYYAQSVRVYKVIRIAWTTMHRVYVCTK